MLKGNAHLIWADTSLKNVAVAIEAFSESQATVAATGEAHCLTSVTLD